MSSVSVTGPVAYAIVRDPKTDRHFYFFADHHFSLRGGCSDMQCDAPDFLFQGVTTRNSDCWTITALLHEVFTHFGKKGETVDFYQETSGRTTRDQRRLKEVKSRREGLIEKPTSRSQADELRTRLDKASYGWIEDIYAMLHDKNYGATVRIIEADARFWNGVCLVPMMIPKEEYALHANFAEAVENLQATGDGRTYTRQISKILSDLEDLVAITEQLLSDPYLFLRQYFEPIDFAEATEMLLNYIPAESDLGQRMTQDLQTALEKSLGVRNSKGQLASLSSVAWTRLRKAQPELATKLNTYVKEDMTGKAYHYQPLVEHISDMLAETDLSDPENLYALLPIFESIDKFISASVVTVSPVLDYYVLSEMLRSNAKHSIFYAGEAHVNNCVSFLVQNGFELLEEQPISELADDTPNRCVKSLLLRDLLELDAARASV